RKYCPIIVEICENLSLPTPIGDAVSPLPQLRFAVVPAPASRAVVKANVRPARREQMLLECFHLGSICDHECDVVLAQQRVDVLGEPRLVPELEAVALVRAVESLEGRR